MNDRQIKQLISKLTGVSLIKEAMPLLPGQKPLHMRQLAWSRFHPDMKNLPPDLPDRVKEKLSAKITEFGQAYKRFCPEANLADFKSMFFVWFAKDQSFNDGDIQRLDADPHINPQEKEAMKLAADLIAQKGVPLAMSPEEYNEYKRTKPALKPGGFNGGKQHKQAYGWAWGAVPKRTDDGSRHARNVPDEKLNDLGYLDKWVWNKKAVLVKVVTGEKNGRWGIFFDDGDDLIPVVPDKFLKIVKDAEQQGGELNSQQEADVQSLRQGGNLERFFGFRSLSNDAAKGVFTPCQARFFLDDVERDMKPKAINWKAPKSKPLDEAYEGRVRFEHPGAQQTFVKRINTRRQEVDPRVWKAMLATDGTMYWQNESDPSKKVPMKEQQVRFLNHLEGRWYSLTNPGYDIYDFNTPEDEQKYLQQCEYLNKFRNFIIQTDPHRKFFVSSQKYQVIIVAPKFADAEQHNENGTSGVIPSPHNMAQPGAYRANGEFSVRRDQWEVMKHELEISDAAANDSKGTFSIPQNVSGKGALGKTNYQKSCQSAVQYAVANYSLPPHAVPPAGEVEAAQQAFERAQGFYADLATQQQEEPEADQIQPEPVVEEPGAEGEPLADNQNVQEPGVPAMGFQQQQPAMPQQNVPAGAMQLDNQRVASSVFAKTAEEILYKIRRLT